MAKFIVKRLGLAVIVLIGVSIISFLLLRLAPGNPARLMLPDGATDQQIAEMAAYLGLDRPLLEQYLKYMSGVVRGDLGTSIFLMKPNAELIFSRLPATILLTFAAICVSLSISLILGIIAGVKKGSAIDFFAMMFALLGQSMSPVWIGLLLILFFAVTLGWLPALGYGKFSNIIMPAITLGTPMAALVTRMMRSGMIDVLQEDYITATYAKGLSKTRIIFKYALKNAIIPVVTIVGIQIGTFLGGAVVTEQIFGWPGVGMLTVQAIGMRDFPLVQAIMLVSSALFVGVNLIVDILYTLIDPRLKFN